MGVRFIHLTDRTTHTVRLMGITTMNIGIGNQKTAIPKPVTGFFQETSHT